MEITGVPQGMTVFHVHGSVQYTTKDGWSGNRTFPTFFVVGGTVGDARSNARTLLQFNEGDAMPDGAIVTRVYVSATLAEIATEQTFTECDNCGTMTTVAA